MKAEATGTMIDGMNAALSRVLRRLHYPLDVMLLCVRWYVAYPLSLRNLEEMMSERGLSVDHSTVHRWALNLLPVMEQDHRAIKRRTRPMMECKNFRCARILLGGIELMRMIGEGQMQDGRMSQTPAEKYYSLAK